MTEKSIMPLNSYSAYTPPFQYTAMIDLKLHFSKLCQNRFAARKLNSAQKEEHPSNSFSLDSSTLDTSKYSKKPLAQKEFVFGAEYEDNPFNRTSLVNKLKHRKGLSLAETPARPSIEMPELFICKSPSKAVKRFVSPYVRDPRETRGTPKSVKDMRKPQKAKKKKMPVLNEDESMNLKEFVFSFFLQALRSSNGLQSRSNEQKTYKFYVGPGNNSDLVAKIVKSRPWWVRCDSYKEAHFVWTSIKHKKTLAKLPTGQHIQLELAEAGKRLPLKKSLEYDKQGFALVTKSKCFHAANPASSLDLNSAKVHNRLEFNKHLVSKKRLFTNLKKFYELQSLHPFDYIPVTYHIKHGLKDENFQNFQSKFSEVLETRSERLWIVKPGENTNRGTGIKLCNSIESVSEVLRSQKEGRTYIVQKYIEQPFLVHKRKFDIRCFALLTSFNNNIQGYFYPEGYIRTSSKEFSTKSFNRFIHLTNDAVQKNSEEYGKFEPGNKISYSDFQTYLSSDPATSKVQFDRDLNSQIRAIIADTMKASFQIIDPNRKLHSFELLGYDFMIDQQLKVWLIEVNTNPCLELSCGYLSKLIPAVLENTFKLTIDQIFCPSPEAKKFKRWLPESKISNSFELIFTERK